MQVDVLDDLHELIRVFRLLKPLEQFVLRLQEAFDNFVTLLRLKAFKVCPLLIREDAEGLRVFIEKDLGRKLANITVEAQDDRLSLRLVYLSKFCIFDVRW